MAVPSKLYTRPHVPEWAAAKSYAEHPAIAAQVQIVLQSQLLPRAAAAAGIPVPPADRGAVAVPAGAGAPPAPADTPAERGRRLIGPALRAPGARGETGSTPAQRIRNLPPAPQGSSA